MRNRKVAIVGASGYSGEELVKLLGDGIARLHGLDKVMAGEPLGFPHGIAGLALLFKEDQVGAVVLGDYTELKEGEEVKRTGKILSVPVGPAMNGRVWMRWAIPSTTKDRSPPERLCPWSAWLPELLIASPCASPWPPD